MARGDKLTYRQKSSGESNADDPGESKKAAERKAWAERRELRLREKRLNPPR